MMVNCSKFSFLMSVYASYALLLAQAEDLKRSEFAKDLVENIQRNLRDTFTIREELDYLFPPSPPNTDGPERTDNSVDQSRRLIREEVEQEERRSVSGPTPPQSESLADNRRESTRYGSIERSVDRQVERLEDREDRTRSTEDSERISTDRRVERMEDREDRARSTEDSERMPTDRQVERLENREDRSIEDSETRVFDRRESRRESREELSEHRITSRREFRVESDGEFRDVSRREVTREDGSEYRGEDRESRFAQDSRQETTREDRSEYLSEDRESRFRQDSIRRINIQMDEDTVRTRRLSRRLTERVEGEGEGEEPDRKVIREDIRDSRSTGSKVASVERNFQLTTFLGQMISLIVTAMLVNKSTKGGFNGKLKQLFSSKVTVK